MTAGGAAVAVNNEPAVWADSAASRWVWWRADSTSRTQATTATPDTFTFRINFTLPTAGQFSNPQISGSWAVDNAGSISINGTQASTLGGNTGQLVYTGVDSGTNYTSFNAFQLTNGFVPGNNFIDFVVADSGGFGGLNVNALSGTYTPIPEPAGLLLTVAAVAGAWRRFRPTAA